MGGLLKPDGSQTVDDSDTANTLNNFFGSIFAHEQPGDVPSFEVPGLRGSLTSVSVTADDVWKQLSSLKSHKSSGPDNCHPRVLLETKEGLVQPLYLIFSKSLSEGVLPTEWKKATVTAIHKKGDRNMCNNYRPVSLTSVICKMLEAIIKDKLMEYFTCNNLLSSCQHGFRSSHSCVTQLLRVVNDWSLALESGNSVDVVYLDLHKAFDCVPHRRLLSKLRSYGVAGKLFEWIENFLSNRTQRVCIRGSFSKWVNITSGVPQGSVLGPILFIIFVNDMPDVVNSMLLMFADDTKLYRTITSVHDSNALQQDIDSVSPWGEQSLMFFNLDKCHVMTFGRSQRHYSYTMTNVDGVPFPLQRCHEEQDLGVLFTPNLKFSEHISKITRKANGVVGIIKRSISCLDKTMFHTLYVSLVRPHLEYASQIWNPHLIRDIQALEKVQRRATKLVPELQHLSYGDRLSALNLSSLLYRRRRIDMITVFKIVHGLEGLPFETLFTFHNTVTRGNGYKLYKKFSHLNLRKFSFSDRIIDDWNHLPTFLIESSTVLTFKTKLDILWNCNRFDYL